MALRDKVKAALECGDVQRAEWLMEFGSEEDRAWYQGAAKQSERSPSSTQSYGPSTQWTGASLESDTVDSTDTPGSPTFTGASTGTTSNSRSRCRETSPRRSSRGGWQSGGSREPLVPWSQVSRKPWSLSGIPMSGGALYEIEGIDRWIPGDALEEFGIEFCEAELYLSAEDRGRED